MDAGDDSEIDRIESLCRDEGLDDAVADLAPPNIVVRFLAISASALCFWTKLRGLVHDCPV
jgi:hypothetical protein